jgi:hypothetical protein
VVALLCSVGAMVQVVNVRPVGFWDLWCPPAVEVVVRRDGSAVEPVGVVGEGFGYAVEMVVELVGDGFGYTVEMTVVEVVGEGFGYAVELHALAGRGCPSCTAFL